ncbi:hypothetical protein F2P81_003807 [Scophthalmus maximus]|uniref:Uncharacterized protein n=1 Tax=Scophthalmus maximus TaxID=52904 RepID=A0A6A4TIH3_SCOMX|nr:hypothetical protein F2P81_003807 [Scophthalmus maximus]
MPRTTLNSDSSVMDRHLCNQVGFMSGPREVSVRHRQPRPPLSATAANVTVLPTASMRGHTLLPRRVSTPVVKVQYGNCNRRSQ